MGFMVGVRNVFPLVPVGVEIHSDSQIFGQSHLVFVNPISVDDRYDVLSVDLPDGVGRLLRAGDVVVVDDSGSLGQ